MIQGGDQGHTDGQTSESIYGEKFDDETFEIDHDIPFLLSMANSGKNTNGSQFFITTVPTPHLNKKHVVFGQVQKGKDIVKVIEHEKVGQNDKPLADIIISNCGELNDNDDDGIIIDPNDPYPLFPDENYDASDINKRLEISNLIRSIGNNLFQQNKYIESVSKYQKALRYINDLDESSFVEPSIEESIFKTRSLIYLNLCACYLRMTNPTKYSKRIIDSCTYVLERDPTNLKALHRQSKIYNLLHDYSSEEEVLQKALDIEPNNAIFRSSHTKALKRKRDQERRFSQAFATAFE